MITLKAQGRLFLPINNELQQELRQYRATEMSIAKNIEVPHDNV
jgi:hypothetical protein